jgi:hypothetical protein
MRNGVSMSSNSFRCKCDRLRDRKLPVQHRRRNAKNKHHIPASNWTLQRFVDLVFVIRLLTGTPSQIYAATRHPAAGLDD